MRPPGAPTNVDYSELDDEALMERIGAGDQQAFEVLFDRYGDIVFSISVRILNSEAAAHDVVQDVFMRLWRRPSRYDGARGQFTSWLSAVARHRAIDERRNVGRRQRREGDGGEVYQTEGPPAQEQDPTRAALASEDRAEVREALAALPDGQRRIIELAYFGGLTQREIAEDLQQPLGTVKTRMRLGMKKLRAALTGRDAERTGDGV